MEKTRPSAQLFLAKKKSMEELEAMIYVMMMRSSDQEKTKFLEGKKFYC